MNQRYRPSGQKPVRRARRDTAARPRRANKHRPSQRPAGRRSGTGGAVTRTPAFRPGGRVSGRATVLALVVAALVLAYAYPVRTYLAQRAEISRLERAQESQRQRIATLTAEREKWKDDEYVRMQARKRLHYVRPGEVAYLVVDESASEDKDRQVTDDGTADDSGPWYAKLWSSVGAADKPRQGP